MPDYLLGSLELMWWVPKMVLGATFDSYGFTWLLSLPTCGGGDVDGLAYFRHCPGVYGR
jgi:hypothetical protein